MNKAYTKSANNSTRTISSSEEDESNEFIFNQEEWREPYQIVYHSFARLETMSFECRAFLIYLFSHKDSFKVTQKSVLQHLSKVKKKRSKGRYYIKSLIKEAQENGYLEIEKYRSGGLQRQRWIVHKEPVSKNVARMQDNGVRYPAPLRINISKKYTKEVVKKSPAYSPPSCISPSATTPFSAKNVKDKDKHKLKKPDKPKPPDKPKIKKPDHTLSNAERHRLDTSWGINIVEAKINNFNKHMTQYPRAYKDKSMYEVVDEYCREQHSRAKEKANLKRVAEEKYLEKQEAREKKFLQIKETNLKIIEKYKKENVFIKENLSTGGDIVSLTGYRGELHSLYETGLSGFLDRLIAKNKKE